MHGVRRSLLFLLLFIFSGAFFYPLVTAEEDPTHWEGSVTVHDRGAIESTRFPYSPDCEFKTTYETRLVDHGGGITELLADAYKNDIGEYCHITNAQGTFAVSHISNWSVARSLSRNIAQLYRPSEDASDGFLRWSAHMGINGNTWYEPAAMGNNVLHLSRQDGYSIDYKISVEKNLKDWGKPVPDKTYLKWGANAETFDKRQTVPLKYKNGENITAQRHALSRNGRYLALADNRMVMVVDLAAMKLTHVYGPEGTQRREHLAVSNDGKFLAVSHRKGIEIVDIEPCSKQFAVGMWQKYEYAKDLQPGCERVRDFTDEVNTVSRSHPGAPQGHSRMHRLYFSQTGQSLFFSLGWDLTLESRPFYYDWKEFELRAEDWEPSAEGYLAMGDSFSSGEGDTEGGTWYEPGTDEQGNFETFAGRNLCHLSRRSYPYLVAMELGYLESNQATPPQDGLFHSVACSGAKIHNITGVIGEKHDDGSEEDFMYTDNQFRFDEFDSLDTWQPGIAAQIKSFTDETLISGSSRNFKPKVITIGIGGNDVGFGDFLKACLGPGTCDFAKPDSEKAQQLARMIAQNKQRLTKTYKNVKEQSPEATVYVHGYPVFVRGLGGNCGVNVRLDDEERSFAENAIRYTNKVIESAAVEAGVVYINIDDIFTGGRLCDEGAKYVNGVTAGNDSSFPVLNVCIRKCIGNESFHPNQDGHQKYKEAILSKTKGLTLGNPDPEPTSIPLPSPYLFGEAALKEIAAMNNGNSSSRHTEGDALLLSQEESGVVTVFKEGLYPGSVATLEVHSSPQKIGDFTVEENGSVTANFTLPDLEDGYHELHLIAYNQHGTQVDYYQSFVINPGYSVAESEPSYSSPGSCSATFGTGLDADNDGIDDGCDGKIAPDHDLDLSDATATQSTRPDGESHISTSVPANSATQVLQATDKERVLGSMDIQSNISKQSPEEAGRTNNSILLQVVAGGFMVVVLLAVIASKKGIK